MIEAVINDKPDLNIVYVPRVFQAYNDTFANDYIFTVPPLRNVNSQPGIRYQEMEHPIIYISLGSIISSKKFCKRCIKAFQNEKVSVILNTGRIDPQSLGTIPPNIHAYSFVPQIEVLQNTDIFVTHCGMNSVNEAMLLGVPMLAMPIINDQILNAKRITALGLGKAMKAFPSSPAKLHQHVMAVLQDKKIKQKCQIVKEQLKKETALPEIVKKIEKLLE